MPSFSTLLELSDMFATSVVALAHRKLLKCIEENEDGECQMTWEEQCIKCLPDIFKELTAREIGKGVMESMKLEFKEKEPMKRMLAGHKFCVATYLFCCQEDMCTNIEFQTDYAERVYTKDRLIEEEQVEVFAERYRQTLGFNI